jgi:hypothetical protein
MNEPSALHTSILLFQPKVPLRRSSKRTACSVAPIATVDPPYILTSRPLYPSIEIHIPPDDAFQDVRAFERYHPLLQIESMVFHDSKQDPSRRCFQECRRPCVMLPSVPGSHLLFLCHRNHHPQSRDLSRRPRSCKLIPFVPALSLLYLTDGTSILDRETRQSA